MISAEQYRGRNFLRMRLGMAKASSARVFPESALPAVFCCRSFSAMLKGSVPRAEGRTSMKCSGLNSPRTR